MIIQLEFGSQRKKTFESAHVIKAHKAEVTGISIQPSGEYVVSSSLDSTWAFHNIENGSTFHQVNVGEGIESIDFHKDGLLLGVGTSKKVRIYDIIKTENSVAQFDGHSNSVVDLKFSENGFFVATASKDNTVKVWDLRRSTKGPLVQSFDLPSVSSVAFDLSGSYLAAGGANDIKIYSIGKTFETIGTLSGHTGQVTCLRWGEDAQWLVSSSLDRNLKFWSKS